MLLRLPADEIILSPQRFCHPRNNKELPLGDKTSGTKEELHPLASAATLMPLQLLLGDETLRNNEEEIPLGYKTLGKKGELHPLESAVTSTPPQIPLGDETPRNNKETLFGEETLRTKGELPLGDETLGKTTMTTPNLQGCYRTWP